MLKKTKTWVALSIILQYALVKWLAQYPEWIEANYSTGFYLFISKILRYGLGWIPFSVGDLLYITAIVFGIRWLFKHRKRIWRDTKQWFIDVFAVCAVVYFVFHVFWGLNYYRMPLHENLGINNQYTTEQLIEVTKTLIEKTNNIHFEITKNDTVKVVVYYRKGDILNKTQKGYENLGHIFPDLEFQPASLKKSVFSYPLSYMGFSGYLNPFSGEAQVNSLIPLFKIPTTASHEVAHQLGYAAENEANFIGCMAALNHDDIYFKYAGHTFGLGHCLNEIYRRDVILYNNLILNINKGVLKNYEENRNFWKAHKNPMEPIFKRLYSNYLKANNQDKGIESYSYVVALLVNYFTEDSFR
ncbi:MAG: DUF3810 domain-containing protein [Aestuariibaculum sp.]